MISDNKRIAKNTLFLYVRMLFKTLVTFYTSRVILEVLGVEDFGIYNVVAGIVALFAFVNSSMAISVQRYLSYEIGRGGSAGKLNTIYSMSVLIHAFIAVALIVLSEAAGQVLFEHYLNIPPSQVCRSLQFVSLVGAYLLSVVHTSALHSPAHIV